MFSIIETTPLSAIHFLIILPQSVNGVINPLTPTNDQDRISPYIIRTISSRQVMRTKKKQEKNFNRLSTLADNLHPKTKENRQLTQSSFIVFVDMTT